MYLLHGVNFRQFQDSLIPVQVVDVHVTHVRLLDARRIRPLYTGCTYRARRTTRRSESCGSKTRTATNHLPLLFWDSYLRHSYFPSFRSRAVFFLWHGWHNHWSPSTGTNILL